MASACVCWTAQGHALLYTAQLRPCQYYCIVESRRLHSSHTWTYTTMAEERARRRYLMLPGGSFQVVEDDDRVDMQLQPPTETPEVARPVLTTTCGSGDTSVPGTSSAPIHQQNPWIPAGTVNVQPNIAYGRAGMSQSRIAGSPLPGSSSSKSFTPIQGKRRPQTEGASMKRARTASAPLTVQRHPSEGAAPPYVAAHPTIIESSPLTVPSSFSSTSRAATVETMRAYDLRIPDVNINAQRNATNYQDDGEASHCERTQMAGSKTSPHHPMSSSYSCDEAVPSTSHAVLEAAASAGNNASQPRESAETSNQPQRNPLENITWVCPFCAEKFNYSTDLIKHWDHTMVNGKHLCRSCGELFMRPSDFKSHYVNHTCKKP
ncbi:uncharacterized protein LOC119405981 [Rhipicephalus sanguineus]|uniref:uncharacterized protein LOC119405981 n=1 Tax=Rhipicephalus sanguineus TaxID=34632 RepID=UPI0020C4DBD9|nr:uncharacterized protein LOC119405981 [Rhipicephalus sanguineus]